MSTMRHRMQEALNRMPAIGVSDRVSDAMLMGAREALRYFLLGTSDAPPELLKALQDVDVAADADGVRAGETVAALLDEPAPAQHAEIWYLWAGKLTDVKQTGAAYMLGAGLSPTDNDSAMRLRIYEALRRSAICGLTYENNAWKPVAVNADLCDFLMPGGICVHMRCQRGEVVADVAAEVRDMLSRIAAVGAGNRGEQTVSLTLTDLEALVSRGG